MTRDMINKVKNCACCPSLGMSSLCKTTSQNMLWPMWLRTRRARTAAEALRSRYFGLFGAPAYLLSDKGKSFTAMVVEDLCTLYGVKKLRTSSYHAQTNGQVERMNQTLIHLIGKLDEDKKACWSKHLPELLMAYNSMCLAVTGYSPHFLLFGRRPRIPVDYLFPTL